MLSAVNMHPYNLESFHDMDYDDNDVAEATAFVRRVYFAGVGAVQADPGLKATRFFSKF